MISFEHHTKSITSEGTKVVPFFNREEKQQSAQAWCSKVDVFHWNDNQTMYFAFPKLRGHAEVWYNWLVTIVHSWNE